MSLYNAINGMNQAVFFILPMLGKHPEEYPRFRDCFVGALENSQEKDPFGIPQKQTSKDKVISIYMRIGGGNRSGYYDQIEQLRKMPTYLKDYDDDFDSTFATFIFSVPQQWRPDFIVLTTPTENSISKEYKNQLKQVFPKLAEKFDSIFPQK